MAVGSPRATSLANDGPLSAPMRGANPHLSVDDLRRHFGHPQKRLFFQTLGCAYEEHLGLEVRATSAETDDGNAAKA